MTRDSALYPGLAVHLSVEETVSENIRRSDDPQEARWTDLAGCNNPIISILMTCFSCNHEWVTTHFLCLLRVTTEVLATRDPITCRTWLERLKGARGVEPPGPPEQKDPEGPRATPRVHRYIGRLMEQPEGLSMVNSLSTDCTLHLSYTCCTVIACFLLLRRRTE
jgi:hypothetical protein